MSGGFKVSDVDRMTYLECERYYEFSNRNKSEEFSTFFKLFALHNLESTYIATKADRHAFKKYQQGIIKPVEIVENNIEEQFEGKDFG